MLAEIDRAFAVSTDEGKRAFQRYHMDLDLDVPDDPFSDEYRDAVLRWYEWLHGKAYEPTNEVTAFDVDAALRRPFPYMTGSTRVTGDHMILLGNTLRIMDLPPGSRILEVGPGWGHLADALSRMGHEVTVVDIEPNFLELIARRAEQAGVGVTTVRGDFSTVKDLDGPFDAALFFECFHHCADHVALLRDLHRLVRPGGRLYLSGEPVNPGFPHPWALRLDGESLWAIRRNGWLELGFQPDYLLEALRRTGWDGHFVDFDGMEHALACVAERIDT